MSSPAAKKQKTDKPLQGAPSQGSGNPSGSGTWGEGPFGYDTFLVHGGVDPDKETGAILTPIFQSTTFVQESIGKYQAKGFSYSRTCNPTVQALERKITAAENGVGTACFSTGMAATVTVMSTFLAQGDHCIVTDCSYGGTNRVARVMFAKWGIEFSFVDLTDLAAVEKAIKPNTKLIFSESPANPILNLTDVAAISKIAKARKILHVCDGTFSTPVIMRALDLGADMALQSTTKYFDGHNLTVGGCITSATKELDDQLKFYMNMHGNTMAPQTAFYTLQTMKTMGLRVKTQSETAAYIAAILAKHPKVEKVVHPSLPNFPQKELADRQHLNGLHGGMLWFDVKGGVEAGTKLMDTAGRPWSLCENLGATESIITCPAVMTHANMLKEDREKLGISDGFIRVSCGIENKEDLANALVKALDNL
eukprot:NODE_2399_length_1429_cov_274.411945_g2282_i0.p2 GENE.NODE_2399_length_1429_cov_274.411945_g2282_i0~~NODE_2399_length_1429_cov_274.411945_g2282_i0.p2  ORF type:complete len:435 (-),score=150.32 NODE_2399_length_1429_cov_274.411945_g2282_i0:124-1392(-)